MPPSALKRPGSATVPKHVHQGRFTQIREQNNLGLASPILYESVAQTIEKMLNSTVTQVFKGASIDIPAKGTDANGKRESYLLTVYIPVLKQTYAELIQKVAAQSARGPTKHTIPEIDLPDFVTWAISNKDVKVGDLMRAEFDNLRYAPPRSQPGEPRSERDVELSYYIMYLMRMAAPMFLTSCKNKCNTDEGRQDADCKKLVAFVMTYMRKGGEPLSVADRRMRLFDYHLYFVFGCTILHRPQVKTSVSRPATRA